MNIYANLFKFIFLYVYAAADFKRLSIFSYILYLLWFFNDNANCTIANKNIANGAIKSNTICAILWKNVNNELNIGNDVLNAINNEILIHINTTKNIINDFPSALSSHLLPRPNP